MKNNYFKDPAISRSILLKFKDSPRTGEYLINEKKDTLAMSFGRAFHKYMEDNEGKDFFRYFYVMPSDSEICESIGGASPRSTKTYKEWKSNKMQISQGREIISVDDWEIIKKMGKNITSSLFYNAFGNSISVNYEVDFYAEIEGLKMKALADVVIDKGDYIIVVDWKSTRAKLTTDPYLIKREILKYNLHFQEYHYKKVIKEATGKNVYFYFGFSENHGGCEFLPVIIHPQSDLQIEAAMMWKNAVNNYKDYLRGNIWGVDSKFENSILIIE